MELTIKQVELPEDQYSERCKTCCLWKGQCLSEVKSFLVNSYGFKNCDRGYNYQKKSNKVELCRFSENPLDNFCINIRNQEMLQVGKDPLETALKPEQRIGIIGSGIGTLVDDGIDLIHVNSGSHISLGISKISEDLDEVSNEN